MADLILDGITFESVHIPTAKTNILLVKAASGFVGCGYFDVTVANRVGDAVAIVTGVKDIDQLLAAPIVRLSDRARELGVTEGMSGRDALKLLQGA
ncbi:MAG: YunC family protein [Prosthecobacter sp.]|uniref:YunC family protein n=1 Tax=Prosthecobacter sp. TaxID=1965333 RepID=UPI003900CD5E